MSGDLGILLGSYGGAGAKPQPQAAAVTPSTGSGTTSHFAGLLDTMARAASSAGATSAGRSGPPATTTAGDAQIVGRADGRALSKALSLWSGSGDGTTPSTDDPEAVDDASADASSTDAAVQLTAAPMDIGALAQAVLLATPVVQPPSTTGAPSATLPNVSALPSGGSAAMAPGTPTATPPTTSAPPASGPVAVPNGAPATLSGASALPPGGVVPPASAVSTETFSAAPAPLPGGAAPPASTVSTPTPSGTSALPSVGVAPPETGVSTPIPPASSSLPSDGAVPAIRDEVGTSSEAAVSDASLPSGTSVPAAAVPLGGDDSGVTDVSPVAASPSAAKPLVPGDAGSSAVSAPLTSADAPAADAPAGPAPPNGPAGVTRVDGDPAPVDRDGPADPATTPPTTARTGPTTAPASGGLKPAASPVRATKAPTVQLPVSSPEMEAASPIIAGQHVNAGMDDGATDDDPVSTPHDAAAASPLAAIDAITASAAQQGTATQQVAAALASIVNAAQPVVEGDASTASAASSAAPEAPKTPGPILVTADGGREIVVKLDPEHLGSVSIRLKMTGGKLDVAITVSNAGTLDVLNRDRHLLSAVVSSGGLGDGTLTLTPDAPDTAPQPSSVPLGGAAGRSPDDRAPSSGDPSGGRRRDHQASPETDLQSASDDDTSSPEAKRAGELYV